MNPAVAQALDTITTWLSLIVTIGAVGSLFYALSKFMQKPNRTQDERLDSLEKWRDSVEVRLNKDKSHLDAMDRGNEATLSALVAILDALISGDNKDELTKARNELNRYLVHGSNS